MSITFELDLDSAEIHGILDESIPFSVAKDDDQYIYRNFEKIDDDYIQDCLKKTCRLLLTLEEC